MDSNSTTTPTPEGLAGAVEAFLSAYRAKYRNAFGKVRPNAPMRDEAIKLAEAASALRSSPGPADGLREKVARIIRSKFGQLPESGTTAFRMRRADELSAEAAETILALIAEGGGE